MTNEPPRVVLVRHGETAWSRDRRHTGRTDIPLTALGEVQAAALAPRLAAWHFTQVLVSPLSRARLTAGLAGLEDPQTCEDRSSGTTEPTRGAPHGPSGRTDPLGTCSATGSPAVRRCIRWRPGWTG